MAAAITGGEPETYKIVVEVGFREDGRSRQAELRKRKLEARRRIENKVEIPRGGFVRTGRQASASWMTGSRMSKGKHRRGKEEPTSIL